MKSLVQHSITAPIQDDDATLRRMLEDLSVPALMASTVQLTGDPSFIRGPIRPREFIMNEFQGRMPPAEQATLRAQAFNTIRRWRDTGCPPAKTLATEIIHEIMNWIACETISDDYQAMYRDEMDLEGNNPRAIHLSPGTRTADDMFKVVIIGCGESGLLAALRLKEAGISFEVIEKNDDVGGTWYENHYPGCRVDVSSHFYSFSFGPNDQFSEYYARQPELYHYFRRFLDEHDIAPHVRWRCEVERAEWSDEQTCWHVTFRNAEGIQKTISANALISSVGILNRPHRPDIPGLDSFAGPVFHAAEWDNSVDLRGQRVALIGAGASGFQIGPAIVDEVEHLAVFQRTPQWMAPNPIYHEALKPGERWAMRHLPGYARWYRFMVMFQSSDKTLDLLRIDPDWPDLPASANAINAERRKLLVGWIEQHLGDHPELLAKTVPAFAPGSKRMLQDNGSWLSCLKQPHVELITERILAIDDGGIHTSDDYIEADIIALATGFRANEVLFPMEILGRDGRSLSDTWDGKPTGLYGISVPDFPNFFMMGGPGTGLAHAGSIIFMSECQMRYIGEALRVLIEENKRTIEPTRQACDSYTEALQAELSTLMWGHPAIEHSWYKAADGQVYLLSPWRLVDYWNMTATVKRGEHLIC